MGKLSWIEARIAVALRWFLTRVGTYPRIRKWGLFRRLPLVTYSDNTIFPVPIHPNSGEATAIVWSIWIGWGSHWRGYGSVRTWARTSDIEITLPSRPVPFLSEDGHIELTPPIEGTLPDFAYIKIKNAAPNPREAAGHIQIHGRGWTLNYFFRELEANATTQVGSGDLFAVADSFDGVARVLQYKTEPVGPERIERLYGMPEWMVK